MLTVFLQVNDVTNAMCLEIIEKFEPVEEWREKGYLGVDGKFQDLAIFQPFLLFHMLFENMHVELYAIQTQSML